MMILIKQNYLFKKIRFLYFCISILFFKSLYKTQLIFKKCKAIYQLLFFDNQLSKPALKHSNFLKIYLNLQSILFYSFKLLIKILKSMLF